MQLQFPGRMVRFPRRPLLMGILNINDDSFSGDGSLDPEVSLERARTIAREGGDMVDVGAESARTNREAISVEEEIRRLTPFVAAWPGLWSGLEPVDARQIFPPLLSINTWRSEVVRWAVQAGADLVNDMSGLPSADNAAACAEGRSALLIMHTVGLPKQDHSHVRHADILAGVEAFFREKLRLAQSAGLPAERVLLDPGLGFAKQPKDDLRLCAGAQALAQLGRPLLWPLSRKGFLGEVTGEKDAARRDAATVGALLACARRGGHVFRLHAVREGYLALKTWEIFSQDGLG